MPDRRAPRSFGSIVAGGSGVVKRIARHSEALMQLQRRLRDLLPSPLAEHCHVANARGRTIIVYVDSAAWATQLRFLSDQLAKALLGDSGGRLQVRVKPSSRSPSRRPGRPPLRLSPDNARLLQEAAETVSDEALGQALRRLARRGSAGE